jgi:hypothetical protein
LPIPAPVFVSEAEMASALFEARHHIPMDQGGDTRQRTDQTQRMDHPGDFARDRHPIAHSAWFPSP